MKILGNLSAKLPGTFFALLLLPLPLFCQPMPPPSPYLDSYSFWDTTNWTSDLGYAPIAFTNLFSVPKWYGNALLLDTTNSLPAFLNYNVVDTNEYTNIDFSAGVVSCVFICDWATADTNQNGAGPGDVGYLLAAGDFSSGSPDGLWAVYFDPGGTNIYFGGLSNSEPTVFVSAPISWPCNSLHQIGLIYSTNTLLYIDGQLAATGGPVTILPATNVWTNGFFIGSDASGYEQARGVFWHVGFQDSSWFDTFDYGYVFTNDWPYLSNLFASWQGGGSGSDVAPGSPASLLPVGGTGGSSSGTDYSLPDFNLKPDYSLYSNLWIVMDASSTNVSIKLELTLSNLTYEILTNSSLASTNWGVWQVLEATNYVTQAKNMALGSNALFFKAALVWCTTPSGLPDWWCMEYLDTLYVDPYADPYGTGLCILSDYLLGLNPTNAYSLTPLHTDAQALFLAYTNYDAGCRYKLFVTNGPDTNTMLVTMSPTLVGTNYQIYPIFPK